MPTDRYTGPSFATYSTPDQEAVNKLKRVAATWIAKQCVQNKCVQYQCSQDGIKHRRTWPTKDLSSWWPSDRSSNDSHLNNNVEKYLQQSTRGVTCAYSNTQRRRRFQLCFVGTVLSLTFQTPTAFQARRVHPPYQRTVQPNFQNVNNVAFCRMSSYICRNFPRLKQRK